MLDDRERALWEELRAAAGDDLPRTVYADWLEEAGRSGEAAVVRAEIALHRALRAGVGPRRPSRDPTAGDLSVPLAPRDAERPTARSHSRSQATNCPLPR